ncbi:triose-phosphate isomerase [Tianweitania populi]|uniref:Triosephosphate isomerase n=1 Tax=Tianweitania populi TaxID=1607949 RepID=A0A8J3DUX4_9HYPH|nr:triose-phosphate isomerase [Tianweitania populi]GHD09337.1 triosephosphate isomerase [Tianweitania populi]
MTPGIRPLVAGNWKMNGVSSSLDELSRIGQGFMHGLDAQTDALICVPATLLSRACERIKDTPVKVGGQDCHASETGAHTGDISAEMLRDAGAKFVIVGHSERRSDHGETNANVKAKTEAAWRAGLQAVLCIGETHEQRVNGEALRVLSEQLTGSVPSSSTAQGLIIAYEPVWAIGTGLTPTVRDVEQAHAHIRQELTRLVGEEAAKIRILYGGSVKPSNARDLLGVANVDGALVGGASLKAADFLAVAEAYEGLS